MNNTHAEKARRERKFVVRQGNSVGVTVWLVYIPPVFDTPCGVTACDVCRVTESKFATAKAAWRFVAHRAERKRR